MRIRRGRVCWNPAKPASPDAAAPQEEGGQIVGDKTKIESVDHTAGFWHGCTKVSEGCAHCYAEAMDTRLKRMPGFDKVTRTAEGS